VLTPHVSIAKQAVRGAAWNLVGGVGSRVVALVGTLVLTRFVAPADYGEIAAASTAILTALTLTDASVGQSILARRVGPEVCFHAFVLHVGTALVAVLPVVLFAHPLGAWLDAPGMERFVPGLAIAWLLERVSHVPGRVLVRDMRFRTVALTRGVAELTFSGVSVALAPHIHGYALVVGNVVRYALIAAVYATRVGRREWFVPQPLRWSVFRDLLGYGLPLSIGNLATFASSNWDNLLVSRFFGTATLGVYRLSRNLAETPATNVAEQIGDVLLPSFAQMDLERRRSALVRSASIMALLTFPLSVGLAAVAPTLVHTVFDRRWIDMAPMLAILSTLSVVRPIAWTLTSFLQAQQRPRALMYLAFLNVGAMLLLMVTVGRVGPAWACLAMSAAVAVTGGASLLVAERADGVSARAFVAGVLRPTLACVPMFAGVVSLRHLLRAVGVGATWSSLGFEVAVGAVVYVAAALLLARPVVDDVLNLVRNTLRARAAPPAPAYGGAAPLE
jgi:PST family polysaccharide transporter